jgi:TonB family protein
MPRMMHDFLRGLNRVMTCSHTVILSVIFFLSAQPAPSSPVPQHSNKPKDLQDLVLYAPHPKYPKDAQNYYPKGNGIVIMGVDSKSGLVKSARMERSTGNKVLDDAALQTFSQWRFRPGTLSRIRIPVTFWHNGSAIRHRMAGAVISN